MITNSIWASSMPTATNPNKYQRGSASAGDAMRNQQPPLHPHQSSSKTTTKYSPLPSLPHQTVDATPTPTTMSSINNSVNNKTSTPACQFMFKIVLVGDSGVGKTGLLLRFANNRFPEEARSTIGVDFKVKTLDAGCYDIKLIIWDTAGQERFRALNKMYYRSANAVVVMYDVTKRSSFDAVPSWLQDIAQYSQPNVLIWLVANKVDCICDRVISEEMGRDFARDNNLFFIETSAKQGLCVYELFYALAHELKDAERKRRVRRQTAQMKLDDFLRHGRGWGAERLVTLCCPL